MRYLLPILIYVVGGLFYARMYRKATKDKPWAEHQNHCNLTFESRHTRSLGCDCTPTKHVGSKKLSVALRGLLWLGFATIRVVGAFLAFVVYYDRPKLAEKNAQLAARIEAEEKALGIDSHQE